MLMYIELTWTGRELGFRFSRHHQDSDTEAAGCRVMLGAVVSSQQKGQNNATEEMSLRTGDGSAEERDS